jgi:ParB family chromosome partitioning protein
MQITADRIEINQIDLNDITFKITTDISTDDLIESIKNVGLISPPILRYTADKRYIVVSGFRRVGACRSLGWQHIDARVVSETQSDLNPLKLAIADNCLNRQLNVIEQSVSISKLSVFFPDDISLSRESQKIGLNVNPKLLKKLRKINSVDNDLKEKISAGIIPFSIGLELSEMDQSEAIAISKIIEQLHLTLNHQKEIIRLAQEGARLNNVPILDVIKDCNVTDVINDPELDRNQKIKRIRRYLKQIRYPEIVRFETNYLTCLQRMKLPESIQLNPPADFEGNNFSMVLHFQDLKQFKTANDRLNELQDHPDFAKILEKEFEDN